MVKGSATGYNYSLKEAALEDAVAVLKHPTTDATAKAIVKHCSDCGSLSWKDAMEKVRGIHVFSAI